MFHLTHEGGRDLSFTLECRNRILSRFKFPPNEYLSLYVYIILFRPMSYSYTRLLVQHPSPLAYTAVTRR